MNQPITPIIQMILPARTAVTFCLFFGRERPFQAQAHYPLIQWAGLTRRIHQSAAVFPRRVVLECENFATAAGYPKLLFSQPRNQLDLGSPANLSARLGWADWASVPNPKFA
jgi:hypothetical protein